ncbi:MAG: DnaJ C-terminal domain-containing protein [Candidatus Limnocylindrales bacterium]
MDYKDYYKILGLPRSASQADVKKAFRKLAREHHPDVKPDDKAAERRFKDINEANAVLSDPAKRKQYDTLGADWESYSRAGAAGDPFGPSGPFAGFSQAGGGGNVRYEFRTSGDAGGFSDFFRTFFGGASAGAAGTGAAGGSTRRGSTRTQTSDGQSFEDVLAGMGFESAGPGTVGGGAGGPAGPGAAGGRPADGRAARGTSEAAAELTLEEAFHGTSRLVEVDGKRLEVTIPRGVDTGSRIRLAGKGGSGRDLYIVTTIRSHPTFTRKGKDLERELPITLREALVGGEVPVKTLRGRVLLTVPAGTQNGRAFRLKGQGMPVLNKDTTGDLIVRTRVVLPATLSAEAAAAAGTFLDLVDQPDPRAGIA